MCKTNRYLIDSDKFPSLYTPSIYKGKIPETGLIFNNNNILIFILRVFHREMLTRALQDIALIKIIVIHNN